eukprot:SAG11_NODE_28224_length_324_cov_0.693333_1_plen_23_part_01
MLHQIAGSLATADGRDAHDVGNA